MLVWEHCLDTTALINMFTRGRSYKITILFLFFALLGCSSSSADLNKIAQGSLKINQELREQASVLDSKYVGADKEAILSVLGKPKKILKEPAPYRLDVNCKEKDCQKGYSDEQWFYEFKKKFSIGWEAYSIYVYFKDDKVVRIK